ncbi:MAG: sigma-70 family RNA polymerase sigma factor [Ignavibacteriaceae bacterium]|nr:sigma-70 family RNA polymerase sigma factor [Ignavibacteriaceae bacterium]
MPANSVQIEKTIKKESGKLFNFIRKSVPTKEDAEDILQDVFYQFVSAFEEIEFMDRISSWLYRVAQNRIIDSRRKKSTSPLPEEKVIFSGDDNDEPITLAEIIPDVSGLPDEVYWRNLIWEEIEASLDEMPEEQKAVFVLNEFEGLSFKEISKIVNEPVNTLLSRKRYAVLYLRKSLKYLFEELKNNV